MSYSINKVGVIGAGTMGAGIAAHCANVGIPVVLLDIPTPNLSDTEKGSRSARNRMVNELYKRMTKSRPDSLGRKDRGDLITVGNTEDDFDLLADCDWIVEVIIERLEPKLSLMARIEEIRKPNSIISSNTSGIPIGEIAQKSSDDLKKHFLGTHFFNPPRYLKLLEIIPTEDTDPAVTEFMAEFGRKVLGKGVVVCKDTPNFIANRFIAIVGSFISEYGLTNGYTIPEMDLLTGPLVGHPKTGTFRLTDLVGIDIMGHVNKNLYPAIPNDTYKEVLKGEKSNALNAYMIENKLLGNKTKQGFYKKVMVDGKREFHTMNPVTKEYSLEPKPRFESVGKVRKIEDMGERLKALFAHDDRASEFVKETTYFMLAYAAYVTPEIAFNIVDVDNANRWGFAHEAGPFEIWDMLGVKETADNMAARGYEIPRWIKTMLNKGDTFYKDGKYYDFKTRRYRNMPEDDNAIYVADLRADDKRVRGNDKASIIDMGDGIALVEFHSKMNAMDGEMMDMMESAVNDDNFDAVVIGNNGKDYCVGANLAMIGMYAAQGQWEFVENFIKRGQQVFYDLKHAPKPIVTAPHQRVLGGGVESILGSWASVADHETYMGLVEVGVGLVPAWGGCKELLVRRVNPVMKTANADVLPIMQEVFTQLATAKVATSAWEAKQMGYLRESDTIVFNSDHRLATAKQVALNLVNSGASAPEPEKVYAAGRDTLAALNMGLQSFVWGGMATEYDQVIGKKLAFVLTGGDLSAPTWVDQWHILDLEREAILSLAGMEKTRDRIMAMLTTGKPLRN